MPSLTKLTTSMRKEDVARNWHLVDVRGKVLGRVVTEISTLLIGKNKPTYTPNVDGGDYVVVINAKDIEVTGRKADQKVYTRYSGYPGGLKTTTYARLHEKSPSKVVQNAVAGMLPKNRLKDLRMNRLYVYAHDKHPHEAKLQNHQITK